MIINLRAENLYYYLKDITAITALCEILSQKPDDVMNNSYAYINVISNLPKTYTQEWFMMKTARISIHIVCKKVLGASDTPERVLWTIIDTITNNLVSNWQMKSIDWVICHSIIEDAVSPIFFADNKHYQVKDYLFSYNSRTNE